MVNAATRINQGNALTTLLLTRRAEIARGVLFGARLALGGLFIYSALAKIRRPYDFLESVYGFELVGPGMGAMVAAFLPWFELILGVCLLTGIAASAALLGVVLLSTLFVLVQIHAIRSGLSIACGCFGSSDPIAQPVDYRTLLRAILIFVASAIAYPISIRL